MKPRNAFEKDLQHIIDSGKLHPLTPKQMEQARIEMDKEKRRRLFLFNSTQTINGMRMTKCYKVHRYGKGSMMTFFHLCIVKAERNGEVAWAARSTVIGVIDSFSYDGPLTVKSVRWFYDDYISGNYELRSIGKAYPYSVMRHYEHNDYEFRDSRMETLSSSTHGNELIYNIISDKKPLTSQIWDAYKVAVRHGYNFQGEIWKWRLMVRLLVLNKKDYRNPYYVCPANLDDAYHRISDINDKRIRAAAQLKAKIAEEKKLKEAWKDNETYIVQHKKWLGIVIKGRGIVITPLQNVNDFQEEGKAMRHCVFANAYYKKKDSLIMSAKDKSGKRLATIEYDLKRKSILQCRAVCNAKPERYDDICSMIKRYDFSKPKTVMQ